MSSRTKDRTEQCSDNEKSSAVPMSVYALGFWILSSVFMVFVITSGLFEDNRPLRIGSLLACLISYPLCIMALWKDASSD